MGELLKFQGQGVSFRDRLKPNARLFYQPGADICYRIEDHRRVQLRYATEDYVQIKSEIMRLFDRIRDKVTVRQWDLMDGDTVFDQVRALRKVTKSQTLLHWIHLILCDEQYYWDCKLRVEKCKENLRGSKCS